MNREHVLYKEAIRGMLPDQEAIRKVILSKAKAHDAQPPAERKTKHRWLIPLVACIVALAVICISVPPVRAAIEQWFSRNFSVGSYMAQPTEARPATTEIDNIIEQTMPEDPEVSNNIEVVNVVPEWQEWAKELKPSVGDVFFDGKQLIVSFDMGGGAAEFLMGGVTEKKIEISMNDPGYIKLNGEKYACSVSAMPVESQMAEYRSYYTEDGTITSEGMKLLEKADSAKFAATIDFSRTLNYAEVFEKWSEENKNLFMEEVGRAQQFDPEFTPFELKTLASGEKLNGIQYVEANLPLFATNFSKPSKVDEEGTYYQGVRIGLVKLRFGFDPEAGYGSMQTYQINKSVEWKGEGRYKWADCNSDPEYATFTNKTTDMTGVKMTAKSMEVNASGAELYVSITCPDSWDELDKNNFLGSLIPRVKADGVDVPESGIQFGLKEQGEDIGMRIHLSMLPSEVEAVDTFEVLPILSYYTGYDDVPYVEGEPTRIKQDDVKGWQEESEELKDCALRFSLK